MKVRLVIMGVDQGLREIGDNGLIGRLLRGDLPGALEKTRDLERDLNAIPGVECKVSTGIPEEADIRG